MSTIEQYARRGNESRKAHADRALRVSFGRDVESSKESDLRVDGTLRINDIERPGTSTTQLSMFAEAVECGDAAAVCAHHTSIARLHSFKHISI